MARSGHRVSRFRQNSCWIDSWFLRSTAQHLDRLTFGFSASAGVAEMQIGPAFAKAY